MWICVCSTDISALPFANFILALLTLKYTFEAYELEFGKTYETIAIRATRKAAFATTLAKIQAHNRWASLLFFLRHFFSFFFPSFATRRTRCDTETER